MRKNTSRRWRVKRLSLRLGRSRSLQVSLRRFRTAPHRRSKQYKQLVVHTQLFSVREVAFAWHNKNKVRQSAVRRLQKPFLAPAALVTLGLGGILFFAPNLTQPANLDLGGPKRVSAQPAPTKAETPPVPKTLARSEPTGLHIPKIALDTQVVPVGLKADGTLGPPNAFDKTGWYDKSPTPGELGPSVIVGHVDRIGGIAVFWRLRELVPGDTFSVSRADGSTANFTVTDVEQFSQDRFPTDAVYGTIDYAGIRLITCGGVFNEATQHYSHNTVVYGRLL